MNNDFDLRNIEIPDEDFNINYQFPTDDEQQLIIEFAEMFESGGGEAFQEMAHLNPKRTRLPVVIWT